MVGKMFLYCSITIEADINISLEFNPYCSITFSVDDHAFCISSSFNIFLFCGIEFDVSFEFS